MSEELMDYVERKDFDFFRYRYELSPTNKQEFLSDCRKVVEGAYATVIEMLRLGWRLKKLKDGNGWKEVINPENGDTFLYSSFEAFSKYAFGFSKTRTSNLMSIAQFVDVDEQTGAVRYKSARFATMNTSQLIEIAPLGEWRQEYFTSDMPVRDMRMCKRYMDSGAFYDDKDKPDFDLVAKAQEWTENLERRKEEQAAQEVQEALHKAAQSRADEDPFDEEDIQAIIPTSEFCDRREEGFAEDSGVPTSERSEGKYNLSTFAGVREFLADYEEWDDVGFENEFFNKVTRFRFKNGAELFAATCENSISLESESSRTLIYFFLSLGAGITPIKVAKRKLEIWLRSYAAALM